MYPYIKHYFNSAYNIERNYEVGNSELIATQCFFHTKNKTITLSCSSPDFFFFHKYRKVAYRPNEPQSSEAKHALFSTDAATNSCNVSFHILTIGKGVQTK